jgi:hypothetical protein
MARLNASSSAEGACLNTVMGRTSAACAGGAKPMVKDERVGTSASWMVLDAVSTMDAAGTTLNAEKARASPFRSPRSAGVRR